MDELKCNAVELQGTVAEEPVFSHENHGSRFFRFRLQIPRLSGQKDLIPIVATEQQLPLAVVGESLRVRGQFRSYNNKSGEGSRLVLTVYAQNMERGGGKSENSIYLCGTLCKPPVFRRTPLGRSICDLMLAVPRRYGRADYLPVIAWGQLASAVSRRSVGDRLFLEGRVQSRTYTKAVETGPEERTAYEISVMHFLEEKSYAEAVELK